MDKTKEIVLDFGRAHIQHAPLTISGAAVGRVTSTKFLDVHITENQSRLTAVPGIESGGDGIN